MTNAIHSNLLLSSTAQQSKVKENGDFLGKDAFLKILMVQLQNQDPMNPMEDKEFIAQMASFSSLEQMTNLAQSFDNFVVAQQESLFVSYQQLIGKQVTWEKVTSVDGKEEVIEGTGKVTGVRFSEGELVLTLDDETTITPWQVTQIDQPSSTPNLVEASHMIGKRVTWLNDAGEEQSSLVEAVSMKDGQLKFVLQDGDGSIGGSQIIKVEEAEGV